MKSIEVMKQENKYTLKIIDRLQELSMNAHEMKEVNQEELTNCIEFIQFCVIEYHQPKEEHILFEEVKREMGKEVTPVVEELLQLQGIEETYLNQLKEAFSQYKEGKYLAIYNIINNAYSYGVVARKRIKKEEDFYGYIINCVPKIKQNKIDNKVAYFHKQIEKCR